MSADRDETANDMPEGAEPPPRGVKAMAVIRWCLLGFAALIAGTMWLSYAHEKLAPPENADVHRAKYQCPMHPQIVSNEPGECPICHMDLEPVSAQRSGAGAGPVAPNGKPAVILDDSGSPAYFCPMDPHVRSAKPGRCPLCKMALEPIPPDAGLAEGVPTATDDGGSGALPPGTAPLKLALERVQSIGVRTAVVEERTSSAGLRVTAVVDAPEQGVAQIHVRTPGFVEAIQVAQTGVHVQAGQMLLAVYSPEILQAQQELLATRSWPAQGGGGGVVPSARKKLELLGMTAGEVDRMLVKGEATRTIGIVAPRSGFVTKKNVVQGSYVTPEMTLYEIQDLSSVYVVADVFLRDLSQVAIGSSIRFVPTNHANDAVAGKIDLVYPLANAEARTRRVRMQIENKGSRTYLPGEFGTIEVTGAARHTLTIPRDALVDTGNATYVFVVAGEGQYVPRNVTTGGADGERVAIDSGLVAGERVVSGATFLIDSESRLQASVAQASQPAAVSSGAPAAGSGAPAAPGRRP